MKHSLILFCCLLVMVSCEKDNPEIEQVSEIILMESLINFSINDGPQENITFNCTNSPALYTLETRQDASNNKYFLSQGYFPIPLKNDGQLKYSIIIYDEIDVSNLNGAELKTFIENHPGSVFFDIEFVDNTTTYRNQYFSSQRFDERNVVADDEDVKIVIGDPAAFECTDNWTMLGTNIQYSGTLKTEDKLQEIAIDLSLEVHLRTWI